MRVSVINLQNSPDRRELMQHNLDRLGVEFTFFQGIDARRGEHLEMSCYDLQRSVREFKRPLSTGEIGCFASHYLLWRQCMLSQEPLVILEDDVLIADEFPRALSEAHGLITPLRLIRLGITNNADDHAPLGTSQGFEIVKYQHNRVLGTQCYALSPSAAEVLVTHAAAWWLPVDLYLHRVDVHGIESYGLHPLTVKHADQSVYPSVIGSDRYDGFRLTEQVTRFVARRKTKL